MNRNLSRQFSSDVRPIGPVPALNKWGKQALDNGGSASEWDGKALGQIGRDEEDLTPLPQTTSLFDDHPEALGRSIGVNPRNNRLYDNRQYAIGRGSTETRKQRYSDLTLTARNFPPDINNPKEDDDPRKNYKQPMTGQTVMPEPGHDDWTPHDYDEAHGDGLGYDRGHYPTLEIHKTGNLYQPDRMRKISDDANSNYESKTRSGVIGSGASFQHGHNAYHHFGPQFPNLTTGEYENKDLWDKYAVHKTVSTMAALHTAQGGLRNRDHDHITGPMNPESTTKILLHQGTPWIVDGHHRLAEARGRGMDTFHASVLNTDQIPHEELRKRGYA